MSLFDILGPAGSIAGLGLEAFGTMGASAAAGREAQASENIAGIEMEQDAVRRQAMELMTRRQNLQVLRTAQQQRAYSTAAAVSSGSQYGSGLQGAYGSISGTETTSLQGLSQNLMQGEQMFNLNAQINQQKIAQAQAGSDLATSQGMASLGGDILGLVGNQGFQGFMKNINV
jgi:hypothetical protein